MNQIRAALVFLAMTGCVANTERDDGAGGAPSGAGSDEAVVQQSLSDWIAGPYSVGPWTNLWLQPPSTHFCALTKVQGQFSNTQNNQALVSINSNWSSWMLDSFGENWAEAYCFKLSGFVGPGSNVKWVSDDFFVQDNSCSTNASTGMWWGDATSVLNGVAGNLRASGGFTRVDQSNDAFLSSTLSAGGCLSSSWGLAAWGNSLFVGQPSSGQLAKFFGTTWIVTNNGTAQTAYLDLAPVESAMCHFTYLGGDFVGSGEWAWIYPNNGVWRVRVWGGAYGSGFRKITASVRCYLRDQR